jgi:hypothetical protein
MARDRGQWRALVNTAMNLRVPQNVGKFLSSCTTGGVSRAQFHEVSNTTGWRTGVNSKKGKRLTQPPA